MRVELIYCGSKEYESGFVPKHHMYWFNNSDKYVPLATRISHELIDHCDKAENGTIENELAAIGGMLWRTENYGLLQSYFFNKEEILSKDLHTTFHDGEYWLDRSNHAKNVRFRDKKEEQALDSLIDNALGLCEETIYNEENENFDDEDDSYNTPWGMVNAEREHIIKWIKFGYKRAQRKYEYRKLDAYTIQMWAERMDREFEKFAAGRHFQEGDKVIVITSPVNSDIQFKYIKQEWN